MNENIKKLYRSREDRIIWGVAGGLAKYFEIDSALMRIILVAFTLITGGLGIIFYIVAAFIIPEEPGGEKSENKNNFDDFPKKRRKCCSGIFIGLIIFIIGLFVLLSKFFSFYWFKWSLIWPVLLMVLGLIIILRGNRK